MPESFSPEQAIIFESPKNPSYSRTDEVLKRVREANYHSEWYRGNESLRSQQETVIRNLPENFLDRLEQHLDQGRADALRHNDDRFNDFNYLIGEIFEIMIEIEDDKFDLFPGIEKIPQDDRDKKAAKLLLDIMHDPTKYGFMQRAIANPDLVKLSLENGTFVIKDATEAKTHLDKRSFHQLGKSGFRRSFQAIIDEINSTEDLSRFGLQDFEAYGINLDVDLDYKQKLVVPRDLGTQAEDIKNGQARRDPKDRLSDYELEQFSQLINNSEDVALGRSSFSRVELRNITMWAIGEINLRKSKANQG